jgi:selenocysteine-specific elongation factor
MIVIAQLPLSSPITRLPNYQIRDEVRVVGTAGHIDHGKSALVQALTGTDPDRLKEEKARGITIDLGFAHAEIGGINVAFVDVPGHERFVKNMLAGVGGIDLVLLVVAADESVMPQTREHFDICKLLRVPAGVIVLTKSDLADAETRELAAIEVRELVAGSFLEGAPLVTVSARTGEGLDELRAALRAAATSLRTRSADGPARLPVDRVFSVRGFGTVVTGTLVSGRIRADDRLTVMPSTADGRPIAVRGVQVHGSRKEEAVAGQRAAVNLANLEVADLTRGQELVTPGAFESTVVADATVDMLPGARPLRHGARVRFHQGTAEIIGRVAVIGPAAAGAAPAIAPGSRGFIRVRLERPAVLTRHDRYILRAYSPPLTIAGGEILDPAPPRGAIRTAAALERSRELDDGQGGDVAAIARMIEEAGRRAFPLAALVSRAGVAPQEVDVRAAALTTTKRVDRIGEVLVSRRVVDELKPQSPFLPQPSRATAVEGVPREEARERLFAAATRPCSRGRRRPGQSNRRRARSPSLARHTSPCRQPKSRRARPSRPRCAAAASRRPTSLPSSASTGSLRQWRSASFTCWSSRSASSGSTRSSFTTKRCSR